MNKAIFLDRDGVINSVAEPHKYILDWRDFRFLSGVKKALASLKKLDYLLILVSNQAGIGKGYISEEKVRKINEKMNRELKRARAGLDGIYICPHSEKDKCDCRKPKTGLFKLAQKEWDIDFSQSFLVGDMLTDIMIAQELGCIPILVRSPLSPLITSDLEEASKIIKGFQN